MSGVKAFLMVETAQVVLNRQTSTVEALPRVAVVSKRTPFRFRRRTLDLHSSCDSSLLLRIPERGVAALLPQ
jgi:hypothetical protein